MSISWNDEPNTRMKERGSENSDLEMSGPNTLPLYSNTTYFITAC
jgi:hypothetical protein